MQWEITEVWTYLGSPCLESSSSMLCGQESYILIGSIQLKWEFLDEGFQNTSIKGHSEEKFLKAKW